ncbi:hypothetical protein [Methanolobus bombayensis]|uniref:hypothetical protein n=1 Tax=Methanolobus bombayensis TaxID=38023 RepID=UPI001AE99F27|nr:hypothetical protein [Methanolobus bombayensis]MBP1910325.1 hypothetical protein [Methanolobus bombayensis]
MVKIIEAYNKTPANFMKYVSISNNELVIQSEDVIIRLSEILHIEKKFGHMRYYTSNGSITLSEDPKMEKKIFVEMW